VKSLPVNSGRSLGGERVLSGRLPSAGGHHHHVPFGYGRTTPPGWLHRTPPDARLLMLMLL